MSPIVEAGSLNQGTTREVPSEQLFLFFFLDWRVVALPCCVGLCQASTWIQESGIGMSPPSSSPRSPPAPSHPYRLSRSTGLSSLYHHTVNSHWLSVLHKATYIFPCYSLNSSHPLLPLLCPQV